MVVSIFAMYLAHVRGLERNKFWCKFLQIFFVFFVFWVCLSKLIFHDYDEHAPARWPGQPTYKLMCWASYTLNLTLVKVHFLGPALSIVFGRCNQALARARCPCLFWARSSTAITQAEKTHVVILIMYSMWTFFFGQFDVEISVKGLELVQGDQLEINWPQTYGGRVFPRPLLLW